MHIAHAPFGFVSGDDPRRFEVSQKAVGTDLRGGTGSPTPRKEEPATGRSSPANALSVALEGFVATLNKHAERNTDVIDVFARALKDLNREVKDERMRREILERRLRETEARVEELSRVVAALARQSWVH
jgi:septal ring factor EnvC (AmiA/AmiB activator)